MKQHIKTTNLEILFFHLNKVRRISVFIAVMLFALFLSAQQRNRSAEELWGEYNATSDDSVRIERLWQLATAYTRISADSALLLAQTAKDQAVEGGFKSLEAHAYVSLGMAQDRQRKIVDALASFQTGLDLFEALKDQKGINRVHNYRGLALLNSGNPAAALEDFTLTLNNLDEEADIVLKAGTYNNLGSAYSRLNQPYEALRFYLKARNLKDSLANIGHPDMTVRDQFTTYNNLSVFYEGLGQYTKAREALSQGVAFLDEKQSRTYIVSLYRLGNLEERDSNYAEAQTLYQQCLDIAIETQNLALTPYFYDGLGTVARMQNQKEIAANYYVQALDALANFRNPILETNVLNNQARMLLDEGQIRAAKSKGKSAYDIATQTQHRDQIIDATKLLAECYQSEKRYADANFYWQEYLKLNETKSEESRKQELIGLQAVMDVELSDQRHALELKEQELAITQSFIKKLQIALAAIALLAVALAIALWRIAVANRSLADKNEQLADFNIQLATTNQQLSLANNKLQQFAFATGHDLKESLRNITSFTQLATIEMGEDVDAARTHLKEAAAGGKRMRKMLDDLLHYSNIGGNDTVIASFPLKEIVSSVKQQLKEDIVEKQGDVLLKTPVTIKANRMAVEQLFYNLIHNGLKYQQKNIPPRISIEVDKRGEEVVFQIKDNGRGVPTEDQENIFQPFHRLLNRMESGSGLGLSICQKVVESYGGRIWYEKGSSQGSVFCFTLPQAEPKGAFLMPA